jgi:hypothetical protein
MGLANPGWRLNVGANYDLTFSIDGGEAFPATAIARLPDMVELPLADSTILFNQFRKGHLLEVISANQVFDFNLDGSSAVLIALLNCVREQLTPVVSNPFAPRTEPNGISTPGSSRGAQQTEATVLLANVLSAASFQGFHVGSAEEATKFGADAIWVASNLVGMLNVVESVQINDPEIRAYLIAADAKLCNGSFASGALPETDGNGEVRLFTGCQEGGKTTTSYYLVVPRPKGGVYVFGTATRGTQETLRATDNTLRSAVFNGLR